MESTIGTNSEPLTPFTRRLRIIVLGYIIRGPLGGLAWHHLQYVLGLMALGHDVFFVEDSDDYPSCYDPTRHLVDENCDYGLAFASNVFQRLGLHQRWAYYDAHRSHWCGPLGSAAVDCCATADLCLNVSAVNPLRPWLRSIPVRVLIDTDPVFTQIRHLSDPKARMEAHQHTHFFTFAENLGLAESCIPNDGLPWRPTRQPAVLDAWPVTPGRADGRFTTVMQWDSYAAAQFAGKRYGVKSDSFQPFFDLPQHVPYPLELALGSESAPRDALRQSGWLISDPLKVTADPWTYQQYICQSRGEFSVAKQAYVQTRSGWFSERSAAYLASGRPVVTQDTGFSRLLPTGNGLVSFSTPCEAIAGLQDVAARYQEHCRAARELAAQHFDARRVLADLLQQVR